MTTCPTDRPAAPIRRWPPCSTARSTATSCSGRTRPSGSARPPAAALSMLEVEVASGQRSGADRVGPGGRTAPRFGRANCTEDIENRGDVLHAGRHPRRAGTFTWAQRMVQWRHRALQPPGTPRANSTSSTDSVCAFARSWPLSDDPRDRPLLDLTWNTRSTSTAATDSAAVLQRSTDASAPATRRAERCRRTPLDGSTEGGCWIYTGIYAGGVNRAAARRPAHTGHESAVP